MPAPPAIAPHRYPPGKSGNPTGRPKGFKGVAASIMAQTGDAEELIRFALETFRNTTGQRSHAERMEAMQWLADRCIGRPVAMVELAAQLTAGGDPDDDAVDGTLDTLSPAELVVLAKMGMLPVGGGHLAVLPPAPAPIDAECVEHQEASEPAAESDAPLPVSP